MKVILDYQGKEWTARLDRPMDISVAVSVSGPRAWYAGAPVFDPVRMEGFVGSVKDGGPVNFRDIRFNPHAHGTHTECFGHIASEEVSVNGVFNDFFCVTQVVSVEPEKSGRDLFFPLHAIREGVGGHTPAAVVLRTLPNERAKRTRNFSGTGFPFIEPAAMAWMAVRGVRHLLTDQPSVDPEEDGGALAAHRAFWNGEDRAGCTITEMVFVDDAIPDGIYLMNLQVAPMENDASPSRPLLFALEHS